MKKILTLPFFFLWLFIFFCTMMVWGFGHDKTPTLERMGNYFFDIWEDRK